MRNRHRRWKVVTLIVLGGIAAFYGFRSLREAARLASCRPHSVTWVTNGFAEDHEGMFPPLSSTPGRLMFQEGAERPYTGEGVRVDFICESDSEAGVEMVCFPEAPIDDWSYIYLGYVIENQTQLELFAAAYRKIVAEGGDFTQDITVPAGQGNCGSDTIYRLRSAEKLHEILPCLDDKLATIPLVIEWPENHRGPVAKVVFLGPSPRGVAMEFPGNWPMTDAAIGVLRELDAL